MKLIKKINNNYALAIDSKGERIIVQGRGIGFKSMPCELTDLSEIVRTYYDIKDQDISLIQSVSDDVLTISSEIFEFANKLIYTKLNPNLPFILADHIQFCLERIEKGISFQMPIYYDIQYLYPKEMEIAQYAIELIQEKFKISLPETEKTGIALNIINSELQSSTSSKNSQLELIELCTKIVESELDIRIKRDSFNYSRFVSHLEYLFIRVEHNENIASDNVTLYEKLCQDYPHINKCVNKIEAFLNKKNYTLNKEEKLYLILHINRLYSREDCYR